jgi:DNA-binding transcriptional LysR family regulator
MTFTMLECFLAAMETMNFTTAGQNVHMTQPAFSRNIAALEDELGFPLFIRDKQNGLRPTTAGRKFYAGIAKLKRQFEAVLDSTGRTARGELGKLVIGTLSGVCVDELTMEAIQTFQTRCPQVDIELMCYPMKSLLDSLEQGKIDVTLALDRVAKGRERLHCETYFTVENYFGVPARLHCDPTVRHSLKEFENEVFLLTADGPELNQNMLDACQRAGFAPRTRMAPDFETLMLWVESGMGITIHAKNYYIRESPYVTSVRILPEELPEDGFSLIWEKSNDNPAIAMFDSILRELTPRQRWTWQ